MSGNRLLDKLSAAARDAVLAAGHTIERPRGGRLYEQGRRMEDVHFPLTGVFSVILHMHDGEQVEALTVGCEGMLASAAFLEHSSMPHSPFETIAQIAGTTHSLPVGALLGAAKAHAEIDLLLRRYAVFEQRHLHQSAACNALHLAEQRLSRWLLMSRDRAEDDRLPLTQEFLAAMLGIRRQSVTQVAHDLQRRGLIAYARGMVTILDGPGLEALSCECYATVRGFYDELMAAALVGEPGQADS